MADNKRCGYVSVIGLPNAGKSTLTNRIVGSKVSIVTRKVQTTRFRIMGMVVHGNTQIILIDTPGIFQAKKTLEKAMVGAALSSFDDGDLLLHIVDVSKKNVFDNNLEIIKSLAGRKNVILVLNKIDRISRTDLLDISAKFNDTHSYMATFMVSALKGSGVDALIDFLAENLPEGDWDFPEEQMSNLPLRLMAAEITREKIYEQLHEELPYSIFVETEQWEEFDNGSVKISQIVTVEKESQKAIVLGKGGSRIKEIGKKSRIELSSLLERPVHLKIFVRVQKNWSEIPETYKKMGLDYNG